MKIQYALSKSPNCASPPAARVESEHGDSPAADDLRSQLLVDVDDTIDTIDTIRDLHNATIRLELFVDGRSHTLRQISPDEIVFDVPVELSPCSGEVVMHSDDNERRWPVLLPDGAKSDRQATPISLL